MKTLPLENYSYKIVIIYVPPKEIFPALGIPAKKDLSERAQKNRWLLFTYCLHPAYCLAFPSDLRKLLQLRRRRSPMRISVV